MNRRGVIGAVLALGGGIIAKLTPALPVVVPTVPSVVPALAPAMGSGAFLATLTADEVERAYAANPHHPEIAAAYSMLMGAGVSWDDFHLNVTEPLDRQFYGQTGVPWFVHYGRTMPEIPKVTFPDAPLLKYGGITETDTDLTEKYAPGEKARIEAITKWRENERMGTPKWKPLHIAEGDTYIAAWHVPSKQVPIWMGDGSTFAGYETT